jgi:hypothetical protein
METLSEKEAIAKITLMILADIKFANFIYKNTNKTVKLPTVQHPTAYKIAEIKNEIEEIISLNYNKNLVKIEEICVLNQYNL